MFTVEIFANGRGFKRAFERCVEATIYFYTVIGKGGAGTYIMREDGKLLAKEVIGE